MIEFRRASIVCSGHHSYLIAQAIVDAAGASGIASRVDALTDGDPRREKIRFPSRGIEVVPTNKVPTRAEKVSRVAQQDQQIQQQQGWSEVWQVVLISAVGAAGIAKFARDVLGIIKDLPKANDENSYVGPPLITEEQLVSLLRDDGDKSPDDDPRRQ